MIKKINLEKYLMIFILIQPFLDFYLLYSEGVTNVFKFSPTTIIRIIFVAFFSIYLLYKIKYNKKYLWLLVYLILIGVYLVLHVLNALNFNIGVTNNYNFSYVTESFYFIRMFIPILLVFITYNTKLKEENFRKTIVAVSLIFSLEIIITNILKISLTAYGGNNIISGNIFDWFLNNNYTFEQLASKGFFYMANQISAVLIMLLPINIYYAIKTSKKICIFSASSVCLAMIILGTRVGVYGWVLIAIAVFIAWIFFGLIHKNKIGINRKKILIYVLLFISLFTITMNSPLKLRETNIDYEEYEKVSITQNIKDEFASLKTKEEKESFILEHSEKYSIPLIYVKEIYSCEVDTDFWIDTMQLPYSKRGGNRNLQNLITKRIYELNSNTYDKYVGMGYSRFRNAELYIEQDFIVHYYTLGIFGIILFILPSFIIATYALIYMLLKKRFRMQTTILCMSVYLTLCISYFSGHVLDELIVTIILGFICGYILILIKKPTHDKEVGEVVVENVDYNKKAPYISVIVPIYNVEEYLEKCLNSLVNQTLKNIEIILVDDGSKDKSSKIIEEYVKKYENVKSFTKENGGLSSARNYGLNYANGEYIAFVDSDDWIELDMYEKMYQKAISNNFDMVVCNVKYIYPKRIKNAYSNIEHDIIDKEKLKNEMIKIYPVAWNKLYKKTLFDKNIRFKLNVWFEDVEFIYRLYPYINSIGVVKSHSYNYLQRKGAITSIYDKRLYNYIDNWDGIIEFYKKNKLYKKYQDELEYSYVRYLYATFVKRLANAKNKEEFDKGVNIVIDKVNKTFPNYKKNKYIKKFSLKNLYLKYFNKMLANIIYFYQNNRII